MSELTDQLGLYGALDHAIVRDPERLPIVTDDLTPYAEGAAGWFDYFIAYARTHQRVGPDIEVFAPPQMALSNLAERREPPWWLGVQRLRLANLLIKVLPEEYGTPGTNASNLLTEVIAPLVRQNRARDYLVSLMNDDAKPNRVDLPGDTRLLRPRFRSGPVQRSTCGYLDVPINGVLEPVAVLSTQFVSSKFAVPQLVRYVAPTNWPHCSNFWRSVDQVVEVPDLGGLLYREVVTVDKDVPGALSMTTVLEFTFVSLEDGGVAMSYELAYEQRKFQGDGLMLVDEGSLVVRNSEGQPLVTSTKRFRFADPFPGAFLAMVALLMGWDGYAQQMANECARDEKREGPATIESDVHLANRRKNRLTTPPGNQKGLPCLSLTIS